MSQSYEYFGKYILLEKLATGGMAEVWLARTAGAGGIGKFVAIKKILPQFSDNPEFIQMFKDEATIAMNLSHSNIVSIYEFGQEKNQLFLVMGFVEGRNLRQILNKMKQSSHKFSTDQIVYMVKEVAAGLDHAHRSLSANTGKPLNITHRDMSPQNIMITFEGEVKIVDFGIAKAESQIENTRTGTLKGKFGYMSPEQAEGHPTDLRTDVFSLGICLWELLANERLFVANNEINTLRKIRECNVPSLTKIDPNINSELERVVMKSLTRDRNLRYQTAAAFHRDLSRFLNRQYPDFSPHDFSVFIKTLYTDEILDLRKRLVDYSKIPIRPQTIKGDSDRSQATGATPPAGTSAKGENTVTETETFTDDAKSISNLSNKDTNLSLVSSPSLASNPSISDDSENLVFAQKGITPPDGFSSKANTSATNLPVLDDKFLKESMSQRIVVKPKAPASISAEPSDELAVEPRSTGAMGSRTQVNQSRQVQQRPVAKKQGNSATVNLMIFITFAVVTYFSVTTYLPQQAQQIENVFSEATKDLASVFEKPKTKAQVYEPIIDLPKGTIGEDTSTPMAPEVKPRDFDSMTPLTVNSTPSGAEIYINGLATGKLTPSRIDVPAETAFSITLRLRRFLDYTKTNVTAQAVGKSINATLQKAMVAYIDIDVKPPINVRVMVNNRKLDNESLPISGYAVPAGTPVRVTAENPIAGTYAEETITLREDQRYKIVLQLDKTRAPSGNR